MKGVIAVLVVAGACSFRLPAPGSGGPLVTITDEDFADGTSIDGVATPWGTFEPDAFVLGGLHARAFTGNLIADADDYLAVVAKVPEIAAGESYRQLPVDWKGERPRGLSLVSSDRFTILFDGEILLPAGVVKLNIAGDDHAVVELAPDGVSYDKTGKTRNGTTSIDGIVVPPTTGAGAWIPVRIAFDDNTGNAKLVLSFELDGGAPASIDAARLRARVTNTPGLIGFGFGGRTFNTKLGETAVSSVNETSAGFVYDLPGQPVNELSMRYAGQLRIDTRGEYTFSCDTGGDVTDGFRLWIDNEIISAKWHRTPTGTATVTLEPGWHDLMLDYSQASGGAQVRLGMTGPDGLAEQPISKDRLRPALAHGLTASFHDVTTRVVTASAVTVALPLGEETDIEIDSADYTFTLDTDDLGGLSVVLLDCLPTPQALTESAIDDPIDLNTFYYSADRRCRGELLAPTAPWQLRFTPTATSTVLELGLMVAFRGGPRRPFAEVFSFVSSPKQLAGGGRLAGIAIEPDPGALNVQYAVRSADSADALAAADWTDVADPLAPDPAIQLGELMQYRITVATDGWQYPVIDRVTVSYAIPDP